MAWIYLAESEDLQKLSKDTSGPSLTVKTTDTLKPSFFQECLQATSRPHQSGTMSKHSPGCILPPPVDIIYGGFPCQDISVAGHGAGLGGERSGLFFEIARLVGEIRPRFVFLENVSAITVRGAERVVGELCRLRYDCRWGVLSASDVGAHHERDRWWLLAHATGAVSAGLPSRAPAPHAEPGISGEVENPRCTQWESRPEIQGDVRGMSANGQTRNIAKRPGQALPNANRLSPKRAQQQDGEGRGVGVGGTGNGKVADSCSQRLEGRQQPEANGPAYRKSANSYQPIRRWEPEPNVGRVAHGVPFRAHRLRGLGNAVVPAQAREAFERLIGLK